jgi:hypothetical protein
MSTTTPTPPRPTEPRERGLMELLESPYGVWPDRLVGQTKRHTPEPAVSGGRKA